MTQPLSIRPVTIRRCVFTVPILLFCITRENQKGSVLFCFRSRNTNVRGEHWHYFWILFDAAFTSLRNPSNKEVAHENLIVITTILTLPDRYFTAWWVTLSILLLPVWNSDIFLRGEILQLRCNKLVDTKWTPKPNLPEGGEDAPCPRPSTEFIR